MKKNRILKAFFMMAMLFSIAIGAFSMTACTGAVITDPYDANVHQVFFLANGGRFGASSQEQILLYRDGDSGRMARAHVPPPMRRGYSFQGWYEVDQSQVHETTVQRITAHIPVEDGEDRIYYVNERFLYVAGHNYQEDGQHSLTFSDLGREIELDEYGNRVIMTDADGNPIRNPNETLNIFRTGSAWNFDFDEVNLEEPRTVFVALWESRRTFVILPTHTQIYRDLDPDSEGFDEWVAGLADLQARMALRRTFVRLDGSISEASLSLLAYRRPGFQHAGFYTDPQFRTPVAFNAARLFMPLVSFVQDEYGEDTETLTTVRIFVRFIDAGYDIVRSPGDLAPEGTPPGTFVIPDHRNLYFASNIDLGGGLLQIPTTYNRLIRGNRRTLSNFVVNIDMHTVGNQAEFDVAPRPYGGLFNNLGPAANILNITFDNVIFNFRHINTFRETDYERVVDGQTVTYVLAPNRFRPEGSPYLAAYHPDRRHVVNAFAGLVSPTTRANNVTLNFNWREEQYTGFGGGGGWWGVGWHDGVPQTETRREINHNHDDYCDCNTPWDCEHGWIYIIAPDMAQAVGGGTLNAFRPLDLPEYRLGARDFFLEFDQLGANFDGYFNSATVLVDAGTGQTQNNYRVLGLDGGAANSFNLHANYRGEVLDAHYPLQLGREIYEGMDLELFLYDFDGLLVDGLGQNRFIGWFILDLSDTGNIAHNRTPGMDFELFWEADRSIVNYTRRGMLIDYAEWNEFESRWEFDTVEAGSTLEGLFIIPMWVS